MQILRLPAFCAVLLIWPSYAYAYIDPGSGMLLWQGLIAAIGTVLVFVRQPAKTCKRWLDWLRRK